MLLEAELADPHYRDSVESGLQATWGDGEAAAVAAALVAVTTRSAV